MTDLQIYFQQWGVLVVFLTGFAEFAGVPIAAMPVLILAGVLAPQVGVSFLSVAFAGAAGAFLGDALWFWLGGARSKMVTDRACGLTSSPWACVTIVRRKVTGSGPGLLFMLFSKFIPGVGNLMASASGLANKPAAEFLALDLAALVLWSAVWTGVGWSLSDLVSRFQPLLEANVQFALAAIAVLIVLGAMWRVHKVRLHKGMHVRDGGAR